MELAVAPDGRVFFIELGGAVKIYDPGDRLDDAGRPVQRLHRVANTGCSAWRSTPTLPTNGWIYLYYVAQQRLASNQRLSRFTIVGQSARSAAPKRILLVIPTDRSNTNHQAGSLAFGPGGELYLSTGDNTNPFESSGFAPIDERAGRVDLRRAANLPETPPTSAARSCASCRSPTARTRFPTGNLFPADGSAGRPEIYVMGNRNPFRISIDAETGWLYWGEVGPDAGSNSAARGPRGYDELNQARGGRQLRLALRHRRQPGRIATTTSPPATSGPRVQSGGARQQLAQQHRRPESAAGPARDDLVPVRRPRRSSPSWATGGRTIAAGPVYHFDPTLDSAIKLPEYYDDTLFIYEWSRQLDQRGEARRAAATFSRSIRSPTTFR